MTTRARSIAMIGAKGMLAAKVIAAADPNDRLLRLDLPEFDITDRAAVVQTLQAFGPDVIINCAAYTRVDNCETEETLASRVNGDGPGFLAEAALRTGAVLVHISTDYVFSGQSDSPYREADPVGPLSAYGRTKLNGEQAIIDSGLKRYFIVRTSWLYGLGGPNFVETILRLAAERDELRIVADQVGSPTYTGDLAGALFSLLETAGSDAAAPFGIYHYSNAGECSWYAFAREIIAQARTLGMEVVTSTIHPIKTADYPLPAVRPAYSVFDKTKYQAATGQTIPAWQESLKIYLAERQRLH